MPAVLLGDSPIASRAGHIMATHPSQPRAIAHQLLREAQSFLAEQEEAQKC